MPEKENGEKGQTHLAEAAGVAAAPAPNTSLLIIEDDDNISTAIQEYFSRAGYTVHAAHDGIAGIEAAVNNRPDVVVLDLMLPKMDGLAVCKDLRQKNPQIPILMLTAKDDVVDKVLGLEMGADDYITKPFSIREFRSRIRAMLRRATLLSELRPFGTEAIAVDGLVIDPAKRTVQVDGEPVQLTYVEFEVLRTLATHPGRVYSRQSLLEAVWGGSAYREPRTIDVHIRHLREKLEADPADPSFILTVRGAGYHFRDIAPAPSVP